MRHAFAAIAFLLAGTAVAQPLRAPDAAPQPAQGAEDMKLRKLFHDSDEASLKRNPISAIFRGDLRYADRLGDYYSDAFVAAERAAVMSNLAAIRRINRARLNPVNRIAYDVFRSDQERALKGFAPALLNVTKYLPIDHFTGLPGLLPRLRIGPGRRAVQDRAGLRE